MLAPATSGADTGPVVELRRILLATNLGTASAAAEAAALTLAQERGATLLVVNVIDPSRLRLPGGGLLVRVDQVRAEREAAASRILERARQAGVTAHMLVWEGDPGESIVEAAIAERADLVVVGSHGRGRLGRLLLGSVSAHVVDRAPCPVVVLQQGQIVRAGGGPADAPGWKAVWPDEAVVTDADLPAPTGL